MALYQHEDSTIMTFFYCCNGHGPWEHPRYEVCMECGIPACGNCIWEDVEVKDDSIRTQNQYRTIPRTGTVFPQAASFTIMSQQHKRAKNSASSQGYYLATGPMNGAVVMSDNAAIDNSKGVHVFNPSCKPPPTSSQRQIPTKRQSQNRVSASLLYSRKSNNRNVFSPANRDDCILHCCKCGGTNELYTGENSHNVACSNCQHKYCECCTLEPLKP